MKDIYSPPMLPVFGDPAHPLKVTGTTPGHTLPAEVHAAILEDYQSGVNARVKDAAGHKSAYGDLFGVSARQGANLISEPAKMDARRARAFAEAVGCTLEYLRGETEDRAEGTASAELAARYYASLPLEKRKAAWHMLEALHQSTIYESIVRDEPGMVYDPLARDAGGTS